MAGKFTEVIFAFVVPRTAVLIRTEMKILRAGKLSPLFHEVTVT